jgi:uncharacterized membrane protein YphA (DoxX/SURF4 family)
MKLLPIQILLLRLAIGALFLSSGIEKYHEGWLTNPEPLTTTLRGFHEHASVYQLEYLDHVALPFASLWSKLICGGELALGVSLLLGCLARTGALAGMLFVLSLYAANGSLFSLRFFASPWSALLFCTLLALFLARAGRWGGLDTFFARSNSRSFFW